ncbi:MAG: FAD-binding oxidoreductase [Phycisphaerales bacterium]|nr:FAD-binding oxidoreductase [Phycisphaerales bacterium]
METDTTGSTPQHIVHHYGHGGCGFTISFGTAEVVADRVDRLCAEASTSGRSTVPIAVLGAGVVGLTTAWTLQQRGHTVRLYAEHEASEATSRLAGALWLPTGIDVDESRASADGLDDPTPSFTSMLHRSLEILDSLDPERWAIRTLPVYEPAGAPYEARYFDNGTVAPPVPVDPFPVPGSVGPGRMFRTRFLETPRFLRTLRDDVSHAGASFITRRFESRNDVRGLEESIIVNCLGLGSARVFDDDAMYSARGVLVHLRPQPLGYIVHDGYRYMFPRDDALVLGGCFLPDVDTDERDADIARDILAHHRAFFGQAEVITG